MAVVKAVSSKASADSVQEYLLNEEKTEVHLTSGEHCDPEQFAQDFELMNLAYGKNLSFDERKYYHIKHSFNTEENITPEQAHEFTEEWAKKQNFQGCQYAIVTHKDKEHIHSHIVINNIRIETNEYGKEGNKYHLSRADTKHMKDSSDQMCLEYGYTKSITPEWGHGKSEKFSEYEKDCIIENRPEDSWKITLKTQIELERQNSQSMGQFVERMKDHHNVEVQIREVTSKGETKETIEYKPEGNRKFCNERRLGAEFGKESLEHEFYRNRQRTEERASGQDKPEVSHREYGINKGTDGVSELHRGVSQDLAKFDIREREKARRKLEQLRAESTRLSKAIGTENKQLDKLDRERDHATKRLDEIPREQSQCNDRIQQVLEEIDKVHSRSNYNER